jgi:hypothetical protein
MLVAVKSWSQPRIIHRMPSILEKFDLLLRPAFLEVNRQDISILSTAIILKGGAVTGARPLEGVKIGQWRLTIYWPRKDDPTNGIV